MINACVLKDFAMGFEAKLAVKIFSAALSMQDDFVIASLTRKVNESFNKHSTQIAAAQRL